MGAVVFAVVPCSSWELEVRTPAQVCTVAEGFFVALGHLLRPGFLMWSQVPHEEFGVFTVAAVFATAEVFAMAPGRSPGAPGVHCGRGVCSVHKVFAGSLGCSP